MPYPRRLSSKMADNDILEDISVVDVYGLASDIGKECEIIIDKFGADAVTSLLPKVIHSLELLENLAVKNEKESSAVQELTAKILQLENDKVEKAEYRQRFEKEIEAIEEQWRSESAELVSVVSRLQEENRRLRRRSGADGADSCGSSDTPSPAKENEVLERLTSQSEKQRHTLRQQERDLQEKQQLIENLSSQSDRLTTTTRELKRKQKQIQNQFRQACEEKTELSLLVQSQQKEIATLRLQASARGIDSEGNGLSSEDEPKYSTRELSAILEDRIQLKQRLQEAEEMLAALRNDEQSSESLPSSSNLTMGSEDVCEDNDEDAPVQGPLPCEPEDAPWRRHQQSGIRKFFRELLAKSQTVLAPRGNAQPASSLYLT